MSKIFHYFITSGFATTHVVVFQPNWSNNNLKSGFFRISGKIGSWIRKTGYPIQKLICVKTYMGQGEYYLKFSAKLVKKHPKIQVFPDFRKIRIPDPEFFWPKTIS